MLSCAHAFQSVIMTKVVLVGDGIFLDGIIHLKLSYNNVIEFIPFASE